jgi:hypothetical protein
MQTLQEGHNAGLPNQIIDGNRHEHADAWDPLGLLRAHGKRPRGGRATDKRDEFASPPR